MVNPEVLQRKLKKLKEYLQELEWYRNLTWEDYQNSSRNRRAAERLIQLIVDVAVDINTHSIVDAGETPPGDAFESFIKASKLGFLPEDFARKIAPSAGERNIIVHEYENIDDYLVFLSIKEVIAAYRDYLNYYKKLI